MPMFRPALFLAAAAVLAGCASQPQQPPGNGKFLVSQDWQFDYPNEKMCLDVERAVRKSGAPATCREATAAANYKAQATLRYNPPGVLVAGHYASMDGCRQQTTRLAPGVEMINPCTAK